MPRLLEEMNAEEKAGLVYDILRKKNGEISDEWADIVDAYDLDTSAETLRKAGVGVKLAYDAGVVRTLGGPAVMMGVKEDQQNLQDADDPDYIDRQKMRDLVRERNKVYRATARDELLREAVVDAIVRTGMMSPKTFKAPSGIRGSKSMVVAIGDIHFGEIMDVRGFCGERINYYDEEIFWDRMERLMYEIEGIYNKEDPADIHLMIVGDCIAGMLRMSQLQNLQFGIVDSTIMFSSLLAQWIKRLADELEANVTVYLVGGNHDEVRPLGSKAGDFPKDNMVKIVQWYLETILDQYKGRVLIKPLAGKYQYAEIQGYHFLMLHGDGGKIGDLSRDAVNVYGRHIDYFICGHLHHEEEIASGTTKDGNSVIIRVPSLCGMDGYAQKLGRFSRPGATIMIIQENVGRRCVYPIDLG